MNHSAKKRQHEQTRKKHKHEIQEHAREAAKRSPSKLPQVLLVVGIIAVLGFVLFVSFR